MPPALAAEIAREHARLRLIDEQLKALARETSELMQTAPAGSTAAKALMLMARNGIDKSAQVLANEVFHRRFRNRREVGSYAGLTGVTLRRRRDAPRAGH